jgi:cation diffusion facilitator family transporter
MIAYYLTHSLAVLSDALESIVNVLAGFIGLYSLYVAAKPRDIDHPYGHGKAEFVSAAAEGALIIAAGVLIAYETAQNVIEHKPIGKLDSGLILVSITAVINYIAGVICVKIGRQNKSLALEASGSHLKIDTYSTLIIVTALVVMVFTRWLWLDSVVAGIMSLVIIINGYKILRVSIAGIMDEADIALLERLVDTLNKNRRQNWIDIHNLRVIKYGSLLHVDCHLTLPWYLNLNQAHEEIDALSDLIKQEFGDAIEMFVHTDGCITTSCPLCYKKDCNVRQAPFTEKIEWTLKNVISNQKHHLKA